MKLFVIYIQRRCWLIKGETNRGKSLLFNCFSCCPGTDPQPLRRKHPFSLDAIYRSLHGVLLRYKQQQPATSLTTAQYESPQKVHLVTCTPTAAHTNTLALASTPSIPTVRCKGSLGGMCWCIGPLAWTTLFARASMRRVFFQPVLSILRLSVVFRQSRGCLAFVHQRETSCCRLSDSYGGACHVPHMHSRCLMPLDNEAKLLLGEALILR